MSEHRLFGEEPPREPLDGDTRQPSQRVLPAVRAPVHGRHPGRRERRGGHEGWVGIVVEIGPEALRDGVGKVRLYFRHVGGVGMKQFRVGPHGAKPMEPSPLPFPERVEVLVDRGRVRDEHKTQGVKWLLLRRPRQKVCSQLLDTLRICADDSGLLGREVVEEGSRGDIGRLGDVLHRHMREAPLGDELEGGVTKCPTCGLLLSVAPSEVGTKMERFARESRGRLVPAKPCRSDHAFSVTLQRVHVCARHQGCWVMQTITPRNGETIMERSPTPWIEALRRSHDTLGSLVEPSDIKKVELASYDPGWPIAEVLSHLGSQAEIFGRFLEAGLAGQDPPGNDVFAPIWERWNARDARTQASDALVEDRLLVERFEALEPEEIERFHLNLFGMELDLTGLVRMRLSEHAVHTWDIAVALDPTAEVAPDAVALLVDSLGQMVTRTGKSDGTQRRVAVSTIAPQRHFVLDIAETVTLGESEPDQNLPRVSLPAEALIRLVYGRLDPAHTPAVETLGIDLDELRSVFPGV